MIQCVVISLLCTLAFSYSICDRNNVSIYNQSYENNYDIEESNKRDCICICDNNTNNNNNKSNKNSEDKTFRYTLELTYIMCVANLVLILLVRPDLSMDDILSLCMNYDCNINAIIRLVILYMISCPVYLWSTINIRYNDEFTTIYSSYIDCMYILLFIACNLMLESFIVGDYDESCP